MSISRFNAVEKASNRKAVEAVTPEHKVSEYYGENVFNRKAMQKYLSKETYKALYESVHPNMSFENRVRCLHDLKSLGYELGTRNLTGNWKNWAGRPPIW